MQPITYFHRGLQAAGNQQPGQSEQPSTPPDQQTRPQDDRKPPQKLPDKDDDRGETSRR